jgi:hypothetical protein
MRRHNPNAKQTTNLSSAQKYVCRVCRGAGKVIESMNGPNAEVSGTQQAQQPCMGCGGTGFYQGGLSTQTFPISVI